MNEQNKKDIMDSFRLINELAGEATSAHRDLARHTLIVIGALNKLFVHEGLEGNETLFMTCPKCNKILRFSWEVSLHEKKGCQE
jgi:hypothetical protein